MTFERRPWLIALLLYAIVLVILARHFPLWADELLQLQETRDAGLHQLLAHFGANPGSVPGGYLTQFAGIRLFGYSPLSARLPSIFFGTLAVLNVFVLSRRFAVKFPCLAAVIFALVPMQFRYAIEGRPYAEALWLSSLETLLFVDLLDSQSTWSGILYCAVVTAGIYVQPFTLLIAVGHLLWLLTWRRSEDSSRRLQWIAATAVLLAILCFAPWYLKMAATWKTIAAVDGYSTQLSWRLAANIVHDLVGGGYFCSVFVILLACVGFVQAKPDKRRMRMLLVYAIFIGIAGPLLADSSHGYFFAPRQLIFILPGLAILAAEGIESLEIHHGFAAWGAGIALLAGCLAADVRYQLHPAEDWRAAANQLLLQTRAGACILFVRANSESDNQAPNGTSHVFLNDFDHAADEPYPKFSSADYYAFFQPALRTRSCASRQNAGNIIAASSAHTSAAIQAEAAMILKAEGFRQIGNDEAGGVRILAWTR